MRGLPIILVTTIILAIASNQVSGQSKFCCANCYDRWLDLYDNIGGVWRDYASKLRYIKGQREIHNAWATAYSMDMTRSPGIIGFLEMQIQRDMAYATAIMNPAEDDYNPFFLSTYPFYSSPAGAYLSWQCQECCDAANTVGNVNVPVSFSSPFDFLGVSCAANTFLTNANLASCAPVQKNVMLLAFYNSNNWAATTLCSLFSPGPRIATHVADPGPPPIPGFSTTMGLSGGVLGSFGPAFCMRWLMRYSCCETSPYFVLGRRGSAEKPDQFIAMTNTGDGVKEEIGNVEELGGKRETEPERDEKAEQIMKELIEESKGELRKAMREAGMDDSVLDKMGDEVVKPVRDNGGKQAFKAVREG